jgi:DNA-binding NtrC family response regulator
VVVRGGCAQIWDVVTGTRTLHVEGWVHGMTADLRVLLVSPGHGSPKAFVIDTELGKKIAGASPAAYALLQRYRWPGNVRELRNVVERAVLLADGHHLDVGDFPPVGAGSSEEPIGLPARGINMEELERSLVVQALRRAGGNQTKAAALLGLNRDQIRSRIEKFGLTATP